MRKALLTILMCMAALVPAQAEDARFSLGGDSYAAGQSSAIASFSWNASTISSLIPPRTSQASAGILELLICYIGLPQLPAS